MENKLISIYRDIFDFMGVHKQCQFVYMTNIPSMLCTIETLTLYKSSNRDRMNSF